MRNELERHKLFLELTQEMENEHTMEEIKQRNRGAIIGLEWAQTKSHEEIKQRISLLSAEKDHFLSGQREVLRWVFTKQ